MSVSLCAIALDEHYFLPGMLRSVVEYAVVDEVVIGIDSRTTDRTEAIAGNYGARTLGFDWHDSFAEARNQVLEHAHGDWTLALDADERLLPAGRQALLAVVGDRVARDVDGFRLLLLEGDTQEWTAARLFRNEPDLRYVGRVHEEIRYLPDPPRTLSVKLPGGPHLLHLGRGHPERDRRLLHLRLRDKPDDAVALCYLALMAHQHGRPIMACLLAKRALECGPRTLHHERVAQLQQLL